MIEKLKRWIKSHGRHPHEEAKKEELVAVHPSGNLRGDSLTLVQLIAGIMDSLGNEQITRIGFMEQEVDCLELAGGVENLTRTCGICGVQSWQSLFSLECSRVRFRQVT
jgi:hypothetical protein